MASLVDFSFIKVGTDSNSINSLDIKLTTFHPISLILSAIFLIKLIGHDLIPESIILSIFDITGREVFFEECTHDNDNKIFVGVVLFQVETLVVTVVPLTC